MNTTTIGVTPTIDVADLWRRAVQGNLAARRALLERIMARRSSRPTMTRSGR
jgi:hypothetical protein